MRMHVSCRHARGLGLPITKDPTRRGHGSGLDVTHYLVFLCARARITSVHPQDVSEGRLWSTVKRQGDGTGAGRRAFTTRQQAQAGRSAPMGIARTRALAETLGVAATVSASRAGPMASTTASVAAALPAKPAAAAPSPPASPLSQSGSRPSTSRPELKSAKTVARAAHARIERWRCE